MREETRGHGRAGAHGRSLPPPELAAGPLTLVRYRGDEARELAAAARLSRDHLRPFMPWADSSEEEFADFVRQSSAAFDSGENFNYWMREDEGGEFVGGCGLHPRLGPGALEIGYWVRLDRTGRGFATAAAGALTGAALEMAGVERVEIHCDQANLASAAVARRLGYELARVEDDAVEAPGQTGKSMIWVMTQLAWEAR